MENRNSMSLMMYQGCKWKLKKNSETKCRGPGAAQAPAESRGGALVGGPWDENDFLAFGHPKNDSPAI